MAKKIKEVLTDKSSESLQQELAENKVRLQKLKFNHAVSPIDNPKQLGVVRREIARINTELRKRALGK